MAPTLNCNHEAPYVARSLRGEGFDASEDGTGRGTPWVPVAMINMQGSKGNAVAQADGPSFTLNAMHGHDMHAVAVPVGVTIHGTDPTVQKVASYDELAQCLRARTPGNIDNSSTTVVQQPVAAYTINFCDTGGSRPDRRDGGLYVTETDTSGALTCAEATTKILQQVTHTGDNGAQFIHCNKGRPAGRLSEHTETVAIKPLVETLTTDGHQQSAVFTPAMQVRRLTPTEAEKLQGFEPGYTAIPWRGKPADQCPDGPRYKALGNSWAVPNVRWIGERIARQINSSTTIPHPAGFFTP